MKALLHHNGMREEAAKKKAEEDLCQATESTPDAADAKKARSQAGYETEYWSHVSTVARPFQRLCRVWSR